MLNDVDSPPRRPPAPARWRSAVNAVPTTARVARIDMVAITLALAAVPAIISVAMDGRTSGSLLLAALVAGSSLAWAADDPAAASLTSLPVSTATRTLLRIMCVGAVVLVGLGATLVLLASRSELPSDRWNRLPEGAAAAGIALAVSLGAVRRGERQAGPIGVAAGVIGTGVIAVVSFRLPHHLPSFVPGPTHDRWCVVAAIGFAVAIHAGRDPARC